MKTAFCFSGQGAQYVGMLKDFYEAYPIVRETFAQAEDALHMPIRTLCFDGPKEQLDMTIHTQPALVTAEVALYRLLYSFNIHPAVMVGFSLGECAALIAANVLPFTHGLELVTVRADAMQRAVPLGQGGMAAIIGKDEATVSALCEEAGEVWPANFNCPGQIVISGTTNGLKRAVELASAARITILKLPVSIPSHCPLMRPAAKTLADYLRGVAFAAPQVPIVSNADNLAYIDPNRLKENLILQLTCPVRFEECVRMLYEDGVEVYIEIGPKRTLSSFVKKTLRGAVSYSVENVGMLESLLQAI